MLFNGKIDVDKETYKWMGENRIVENIVKRCIGHLVIQMSQKNEAYWPSKVEERVYNKDSKWMLVATAELNERHDRITVKAFRTVRRDD